MLPLDTRIESSSPRSRQLGATVILSSPNIVMIACSCLLSFDLITFFYKAHIDRHTPHFTSVIDDVFQHNEPTIPKIENSVDHPAKC